MLYIPDIIDPPPPALLALRHVRMYAPALKQSVKF